MTASVGNNPYSATESLDLRPPNWMDKAACVGLPLEAFFCRRAEAAAAIKVCHGCPVMAQCYKFARESGQRYGVWGGDIFGVSMD